MAFLPVFLWTDILVYLLIAVVMTAILYIRNKPHLLSPWKIVVTRKRGVMSLMILLLYVSIGLLDSLHFRAALQQTEGSSAEQHYATEVTSVLDVMLTPLRSTVEKTYSAPFATRLFVREMKLQDGMLVHHYPRLQFGGSHLSDEADKWPDILARIIVNSGVAIILLISVFVLWAGWCARGQWTATKIQMTNMLVGHSIYPVRTFYFMLLALLLVALNLFDLGQHYHVFGTDKVGQDVLYQSLKSIRTGLVIGTLTTLIMLPVAIFLGIAAGYFRGWIDDLIQYIYTTLNSIPGVLLIAGAILMLQVYINNHPEQFTTIAERADIRLLFLCIILGVTSWTGLCRILRGETLKLREAEYVLAARAMGVSRLGILRKHILPNLMHIVLITVVLDFSGLVLAEAVLTYVGVGVDPSMMSWGNMINSARLEMAREPVVWWSLTAAFISMFVLVLAANLFADVVRDAFDPRLQGAR